MYPSSNIQLAWDIDATQCSTDPEISSPKAADVASSGLSEEALRALPPDATEPEVFDAVYRQHWNPGAVGGVSAKGRQTF